MSASPARSTTNCWLCPASFEAGDASGCGNETASERAVMRKYMIESVKFGIAGAIAHPQIDMKQVNYSKQAWAKQPHQMISYVSCHDDMCL
ncbi:MAG: hypothetical protein MR448_02905, partial [Parabacteroides sp.]|nr:hypothetical protein [Parabacteroides sp.]